MTWEEFLKTIRPEEEICEAARSGNLSKLKLLITADNINLQDHRGHTALIIACYNGYKETAKFLIEQGAEIDLQDHTGNTALMGASFKGHLEIVQLLLQSGADPKLRNPQGLDALGFAKLFGRSEIQKFFEGSTNLEQTIQSY